ncbi:hypothetical protein LAZ67_2001427, partial [Cordylochernes scorpioides]
MATRSGNVYNTKKEETKVDDPAKLQLGADLSVVDLRTALFAGREINSLTKTCSGPDGKKLDMKLSNVNYLIEPKDNPGQDPLIVHVSRIKPYFERIDE